MTGGLDGVLRVVTLLRGRRYPVQRLQVEVGDDAAEGRIECAVTMTAFDADLLVERLRRIPAVLSAESTA